MLGALFLFWAAEVSYLNVFSAQAPEELQNCLEDLTRLVLIQTAISTVLYYVQDDWRSALWASLSEEE